MDALAMCLEDLGDRVLGEPVDLQPGDLPAELGRDCHISAGVTKPDRRRDVERSLGPAAASTPANQPPRLVDGIDELAQQQIDLDRIPGVRRMPTALKDDA